MNTSTILDMLRDDPALLDDPSAFLKRMNAPFDVVTEVKETTVEKTITTSTAEQNGGPTTQADIDAALAILKQRPFIEQAEAVAEKIKAAVAAGEVIDKETLIQKATKAATDVTTKKDDGWIDVPPAPGLQVPSTSAIKSEKIVPQRGVQS